MAETLSRAVRRAMGRRPKGPKDSPAAGNADGRSARAEVERLDALGVGVVHAKSPDDEIASYCDRLWDEQNDLVEPLEREWMQALLYCAGYQHLAYHRDRREWMPRRATPGRIRRTYNVLGKAVKVRVARLTEHKPTVSVVAATADLADVLRTEYKETLFWGLWAKLNLHQKLVVARRWATKCGSGFLRLGYDPEAGVATPVTRFRDVVETIETPVEDPATGMPALDPFGAPVLQREDVNLGPREFYYAADGEELGPVEEEVEDEATGQVTRRRLDPPEGTDYVHEGEAFATVRSPFNIRFDRYAETIADSWYVQDTQLLPATAIVSQFPDAMAALREAEPASGDDRRLGAPGLARLTDPSLLTTSGAGSRQGRTSDGVGSGDSVLDREYLVRETWIFPTTRLLRKLWGPRGRYLVTVGGKLVHKAPLPAWAAERMPYVQLLDEPEEGNHYGKPFTRDLIDLQDDLNGTRSMRAEGIAVRNRLILAAKQNHGASLSVLPGMPAALLTYRNEAPTPLSLGQADNTQGEYYEETQAAFADLANTNDASQGKLPSAGIAAQAIYALQYADEKSVTETSALQDEALRQLALALDAITRHEYVAERKIRVVGEDRSYVAETDIRPEHLDTQVDYFFVPGSMLSRNREAIRNEMLALRKEGVIDAARFQKFFASSVPEVFRTSYDLQEAHARRTLLSLLKDPTAAPQLEPWVNPDVQLGVFEEFALTARWDTLDEPTKMRLMHHWQALKVAQAQRAQAMAGGAPAGAPAAPAGGPGGAEQQAAAAGQLGGVEQPFQAPEGAAVLQQQANAAQAVEGPQ